MKQTKGNILLIILATAGILAASVGGYFWWSSSVKAPTSVETTAVKPMDNSKPKEATPPANNITNWKTFTEAKYKFQFSYPPRFDYQSHLDRSGGVQIYNTPKTSAQWRPGFFEITIYPNFTVEKWVSVNNPSNEFYNKELDPKLIGTTTVSDMNAFIYTHSNAGSPNIKSVLLLKENIIYQISTEFPDNPLFDQILSTFRFD